MRFSRLPAGRHLRVALLSSLVLIAACGDEPQGQQGGMKVPVSVVTVEPARTEVLTELPGRVDAIKNAQIRARVTGIVVLLTTDRIGVNQAGIALGQRAGSLRIGLSLFKLGFGLRPGRPIRSSINRK